jgi:ribosome biogenesis GTPase A
MTIQWFPGHMHEARLAIQAMLPKSQLVIEILDARIPYSSENPMLAELRGDKPCLKILAKSDLADEALTVLWQNYFDDCVGISAHAATMEDVPTIRRIKQFATRMLPDRKDKPITAMIVGIPNVGKSTIINFLAGRKVAKTGNVPAITKQQQRVEIGDGITLIDTPGVLWPNVRNVNSGFRLALLGSVQETALDYAEVGFFGVRFLLSHYPFRLTERYGLETLPTSELEAIEAIGRKRGCLLKGDKIDIDRASRILVTELRSGALGPITLETPELMEYEKEKTATEIAEKEAASTERDAKRKKQFRDKQRAQRKSREMG